MDGWMARWMDGWMARWMDGWLDGWMDGWLDGWMDGWMDGYIYARTYVCMAGGVRDNNIMFSDTWRRW